MYTSTTRPSLGVVCCSNFCPFLIFLVSGCLKCILWILLAIETTHPTRLAELQNITSYRAVEDLVETWIQNNINNSSPTGPDTRFWLAQIPPGWPASRESTIFMFSTFMRSELQLLVWRRNCTSVYVVLCIDSVNCSSKPQYFTPIGLPRDGSGKNSERLTRERERENCQFIRSGHIQATCWAFQ